MQGISIPLWLAGTLGLLGMLSGGMVVYIALPRPGNIPLLPTTTEDELVNSDENTPST
jgi:hypothetical protein